MAQVVETELKSKIASANVYSLMCDESDDVSVKKKLVCYVRFIPGNGSFKPETHFLDNVTIDKGDAETVYNGLKSAAEDKGIDVSKVMFFGSDGASVMTGSKSGVSARLRQDQPKLLNIHCMAHKLALCTSQASDSVTYLKKYKETLTNLYYHFKHSSLRTTNLAKIEEVLNDKQLKIKEVHSVRWFAFYSALEAVYHSWGALVTYFEQEKQSEKGGAAKGLHSQLTQFEFVGVTHLLMDIIPVVTKLSLSFQKQDIDISIVQPLVQATISQLRWLLTNNGRYMQEFSSCINIDANLMNIKNHQISLTKNKQTHLSNIRTEFITKVIEQIERRFPSNDLSVLSSLAILGMRGLSFVNKDKLSEHGCAEISMLCEAYGDEQSSFIDQSAVKMDWEVLKSLVIQQKYPTDNIYMLWSIIHDNHKDLVTNILKIAELALIAPLQTADCERGFSTQNDIKTNDRNRLSGDRLNKLMRIAMHSENLENFNFEECFQVWCKAKERRAFQGI